jgi:hypothetical protein
MADTLAWRHDSVLKQLFTSILHHLDSQTAVYADLPGHRASDNPPATIPPSILVSASRLHLVVVNSTQRQIAMLELTVCGNTPEAIQAAHNRKSNKVDYLHLISDLTRGGWSISYSTIEVGCLGHYCHSSPAELHHSCKLLLPSIPWRDILTRASTIAINSSQTIFLARKQVFLPSNRPLAY